MTQHNSIHVVLQSFEQNVTKIFIHCICYTEKSSFTPGFKNQEGMELLYTQPQLISKL